MAVALHTIMESPPLSVVPKKRTDNPQNLEKLYQEGKYVQVGVSTFPVDDPRIMPAVQDALKKSPAPKSIRGIAIERADAAVLVFPESDSKKIDKYQQYCERLLAFSFGRLKLAPSVINWQKKADSGIPVYFGVAFAYDMEIACKVTFTDGTTGRFKAFATFFEHGGTTNIEAPFIVLTLDQPPSIAHPQALSEVLHVRFKPLRDAYVARLLQKGESGIGLKARQFDEAFAESLSLYITGEFLKQEGIKFDPQKVAASASKREAYRYTPMRYDFSRN